MDRDSRKRDDFKDNGVQLLEIPYWWNGSWQQLLATLKQRSR
jgi:hypothetical protein